MCKCAHHATPASFLGERLSKLVNTPHVSLPCLFDVYGAARPGRMCDLLWEGGEGRASLCRYCDCACISLPLALYWTMYASMNPWLMDMPIRKTRFADWQPLRHLSLVLDPEGG